MTRMPESRRGRRAKRHVQQSDRHGLTLIEGGLASHDGAGPVGVGAGGVVPADDDELGELYEMLADLGLPEDVVGTLATADDPVAVFGHLIEAGVLPSQEESLTEMLGQWRPLLKPGCGPLDAELSGVEFVGVVRDAAQDEEAAGAILANMISQAEERGGAEALAMMRVLAAVGPRSTRTLAASAADRLVRGGLKDRPWVADLGAPEAGAGFGYLDEFGAQESVAVTFAYGRKQHVLVALIDHDLGGGVKDCWLSDLPDRIRAEYRQAAKRYRLEFLEYDAAQVRAILDRALDRPPCPVEPDQLVSVRDYLDLVRQRVALLPAGAPVPHRADDGPVPTPRTGRPKGVRAVGNQTIHRVKVTLRGAKPPIWRRLEVPSGITLDRLHDCVQTAFGWLDCHLYVFETPLGDFGVADPELGYRSAKSTRLDRVAMRAGDRVRYTYDFGDGWEHDILVEDTLTAEPGIAYPRCVAGRRAGPPEDCGGVWGYAQLVEILADPGHEEHMDRLEWLGIESGSEFDPAHLDLDEVNRALSGKAKVLVKR
jgi:Plasmid pRiA4b ORF-3-like protein